MSGCEIEGTYHWEHPQGAHGFYSIFDLRYPEHLAHKNWKLVSFRKLLESLHQVRDPEGYRVCNYAVNPPETPDNSEEAVAAPSPGIVEYRYTAI
jgi:hypothetical protein